MQCSSGVSDECYISVFSNCQEFFSLQHVMACQANMFCIAFYFVSFLYLFSTKLSVTLHYIPYQMYLISCVYPLKWSVSNAGA